MLSLRRGPGRFLIVGKMHSLPTRVHKEQVGRPISPGTTMTYQRNVTRGVK